MKRVTLKAAERVFRSHYPKARIEGYTGNDRKRYYLVHKDNVRGEFHVGEGDTKPKAWRDACERLNITEAKS